MKNRTEKNLNGTLKPGITIIRTYLNSLNTLKDKD